MKAAIAACKGRICQRLDCADELIVFDVKNTRADDRQDLDLSDWPAHGRSSRIVHLAVDQLICGAVSSFDEAGLDGSGIGLIVDVAGPVEAVVQAVLSGTIASGQSFWNEPSDRRLQS